LVLFVTITRLLVTAVTAIKISKSSTGVPSFCNLAFSFAKRSN
jgi:hypothetical protein